MNQKKSKKLRKRARGMTVGLPEKEYETAFTGAAVLTQNCTRGVYQRLKKEYLEKKRKK